MSLLDKSLSELDKHGYYNKTIHTCILKLHLPLPIINGVFKNLHHKNEVSGVFYVDNDDQVTHVDQNEGDAGSVYTPNNVINYHTHPIHAYRNGKTCYGSPSGEDYRETLKFALNGNKAHLVFTVEGLYTIQVSPCKIKKMIELLTDTERGILIFMVEEYFKTTHEFRCVDELNDLGKNVTPYSFVDFANTFDLSNLLSDKKMVVKQSKDVPVYKTGHSSIHSKRNIKLYAPGVKRNETFYKIPNVGFPSISDDKVITQPIKKYLSQDDLENLRKINKSGEEDTFNAKNINDLIVKLKKISKDFDTVPCSIEWNSNPNAWFFVNFFPTQHYLNQTHQRKDKFVMPEKQTNEIFIKGQEPFIRIFSNSKTGCKITKIAQTHNFNMGKRFSFGKFKTRRSTFGKQIKSSFSRVVDKDIIYLES